MTGERESMTVCLSGEGFSCAADEDDVLRIVGPTGHGRLHHEAPGRMRFRWHMSTPRDSVALARVCASGRGKLRIMMQRCAFLAERTCGSAAEVLAVLRQVDSPCDAPREDPLPVEDCSVGVLDMALPIPQAWTFLRLQLPCSETIDRARSTFLLVANACLHATMGGWIDGPGLVVGPMDVDHDLRRREIYEVGNGLAALATERIARSYLEMSRISSPDRGTPRLDGSRRGAQQKGEIQ